MTDDSQTPALLGKCFVVADADGRVGRTLVDELTLAGATVIALRHRAVSASATRHRSAATPQVVSVPSDLRDSITVRSAFAWALERCGRLDAAIITDSYGVAPMIALAECALTELALTARFSGADTQLLCLARTENRPEFAMLAASRAIPFVELVDIRVVESWPDTPLSSLAAARSALEDVLAFRSSPSQIPAFRTD